MMHFYLILTLLANVLRAENGVQFVTDHSKYPYMAAIFLHDKYHTAGIIVGCKYVLVTADSTTVHTGNLKRVIDVEHMNVIVGSILNMPNCKTRVFKVSKILFHEKYNIKTGFSDIAILKLKGVFPRWLSNTIRPISVHDISEKSEVEGSKCSVLSWGRGTYKGHKNVPLLTVIDDFTVISNDTCRTPSWPELQSDSFCADKPGNVPCYNMTGSSFLCKGYLSGIVSQSDHKDCKRPIVLTDLAVYKVWILKTITIDSSGCITAKNGMEVSLTTIFVIYILQRVFG